MCSTPTEAIAATKRTFSHEERASVLNTLDTILSSGRFESAPQMSAFLRFVVEQTLEGNQNRIKAFTVAVDALGKEKSFDPQNDPLVRVLAGRLRTALADYNEENLANTVTINMAPGSYVPSFEFNASDRKKQARTKSQAERYSTLPPASAPQADHRPGGNSTGVITVEGPSVFVTTIDTRNALEDSLQCIVSSVIAQSTTANAYRLLDSASTVKFGSHDYFFSIKSMLLQENTRICMQLLKARTGRVVDASQIDLSKTAVNSLNNHDLHLIVVAAQSMLHPNGPLLTDYASTD